MSNENEETKNEESMSDKTKRNPTLACYHPGYVESNAHHKFCCHFQRAILKFASNDPKFRTDVFGNWFGRMITFGYKVSGMAGSFAEINNELSGVNEDEFRRQLRDEEIRIEEYDTDFSSLNVSGNKISVAVKIKTSGNVILNGQYAVTYTVQNDPLMANSIDIKQYLRQKDI